MGVMCCKKSVEAEYEVWDEDLSDTCQLGLPRRGWMSATYASCGPILRGTERSNSQGVTSKRSQSPIRRFTVNWAARSIATTRSRFHVRCSIFVALICQLVSHISTDLRVNGLSAHNIVDRFVSCKHSEEHAEMLVLDQVIFGVVIVAGHNRWQRF